MWHTKYRKLISRITIVTISLPATILAGFVSAPTAHGAANVLLNEVNPVTQRVELYSSDNTTSLNGLELDIVGFAPINLSSDLLNAGGFDAVNTIGDLNNTNGNVIELVRTSDLQVLDRVETGNSKTANVPLPDAGNSVARMIDGTGEWVSNTTWTPLATNGTITAPTAPTALSIATTSNNAAHFITPASALNGVVVKATTSAADAVTTYLYDSTLPTPNGIPATGTALAAGPFTLNPVLNASTLADGPIYLRGYSEDTATHIRSAWSPIASSLVSSDTKDTVAPVATAPVIITPTNNTKPVIAWTAAADVNAVTYQIKIGTSAGASDILPLTAPISTLSYTPITALTDGIYYATLLATDAAGNISQPVASAAFTIDTITPAAPINVTTSVDGTGRVTISYSSVSDAVNYQVFSDNRTGTVNFATPLATTNGLSYTTTTLSNGTYQFVVRAIDAAGNLGANTATTPATVSIAPNSPQNIAITAGDGTATLSWTGISGATSYSVFYRAANDTGSAFKSVSVGSRTSATIAGLKNGTIYLFNVQAFDAQGNSSKWNQVSVQPTTPIILATAETATPTAVTSNSTSSTTTTTPATPTTNDNAGKVSSASTASTDDSNTSRTRLYVTLLIVLVAAGAGAAGYYGYQWWSERPTTTPEPVKPNPVSKSEKSEKPDKSGSKTPKKRPSKGGRW